MVAGEIIYIPQIVMRPMMLVRDLGGGWWLVLDRDMNTVLHEREMR